MAFKRTIIKPDQAFITDMITRQIAVGIPTGYRWFDQTVTDADKEVGRQIRAWGQILGALSTAVETQRYDIFTATQDLDLIGNALKLPRNNGESDDAYYQRITGELVALRVTVPSIISALNSLYPSIGVDVYEPWTDLMLWSKTNYLSSSQRLCNQYFHRGGTFQVVSNAYIPNLESFMDGVRAGGFKAFGRLSMEALLNFNDDPLAAIDPKTGEPMDFVSMSLQISEESYGTGYDYDPICIEIASDVTADIYSGYAMTWSMGFVFNNLTKNYVCQMDMLASISAGKPVYDLVTYPDFDPTVPSDVQPAPQINYKTALGSGVIGDGSL